MVKEGNLEPPAGHPKSCATCLFKIGGPMCPADRISNEDYMEGGPCSNWRYQGKYSIREMEHMPIRPRSDKRVNREIEKTRKRYRNKVKAGTG